MYVHKVYFEIVYKTDQQTVHEFVVLVSKATSTEARLWFWAHVGEDTSIPWEEVDCLRITHVCSEYIRV